MEQVSGLSNWKFVIRRETDGILILHATTCDKIATLPDELFGLPVTRLAHHALSPNAKEVSGEEAFVTCGQVTEESVWDNRQIHTLNLPKTITHIEDYAFLNCVNLRELRLYDGVKDWGSCVFMNCRTLDTFHLTRISRQQGGSLEFFNSELSCDLDVTIQEMDGQVGRLVFPAYREDYEESISGHFFKYEIHGAGYPYHHVFRQRQLSIKDYDALWEHYISTECEKETAIRLAWYRLRWPLELSKDAEKQYLNYLREQTAEAVRWLLTQRDQSNLRFLLQRTEPDRETLSAACAVARENQAAEALAILLEEQHRRFPVGVNKSFDL